MKNFFLLLAFFFVPLSFADTISATEIEKKVQISYQLKIEGIEDKQALENAEIYTKLLDLESIDASARSQYLIRKTIEKAISVYGYFSPVITFTLQKQTAQKVLLIANVQQGDATKIKSTQIQCLGEAEKDEAFQDLLYQAPVRGTQLYQKRYDDYKDDIRQLALERGYFDGEFTQALLSVRPSTKEAWWTLTYQSGQRYKFGNIRFENNQIDSTRLQNIMPMKEGDFYHINAITQFSNDLNDSGWFNSVTIQPTINKETKEMDLSVLFYPRKKNVFKIGVGYVSDEGPRFQLGWNKPWINSKGHSLNSDFYLSKPKITFEANYRMPVASHPLDYYYESTFGVEQERENDTESRAITSGIVRYWDRETGWQNALGLKIRYDAFTQANQDEHTLLVYPLVSAIRTRFRGGLFPYWGDTQRLTVEVGNKIFLSDVDFYKIQAVSIWIRQPWENHRFMMRAEAGFLHTRTFDKIPPSLRFFIGGDRTVRGYGYKKISPKNEEGKLIGGSFMANGSLEYNLQVYPSWWLASFYDTGFVIDAKKDLNKKDLYHSAGLGVRWVSPVGAVKIDIATPIADPEGKHNVQFYLGLGTEL